MADWYQCEGSDRENGRGDERAGKEADSHEKQRHGYVPCAFVSPIRVTAVPEHEQNRRRADCSGYPANAEITRSGE